MSMDDSIMWSYKIFHFEHLLASWHPTWKSTIAAATGIPSRPTGGRYETESPPFFSLCLMIQKVSVVMLQAVGIFSKNISLFTFTLFKWSHDGGSSKSTFFKQLQTIHGHGFTDKDRISFKNHVYHQIIEQMKRIISRAEEFSEDYPDEFGDCKIGNDALESAEYFELLRDDAPVTEDIAAKIDILWHDEGIQNTFKKRAKFGVTDSTGYFFNEINRISSPNYIPSFEVWSGCIAVTLSAILRDFGHFLHSQKSPDFDFKWVAFFIFPIHWNDYILYIEFVTLVFCIFRCSEI